MTRYAKFESAQTPAPYRVLGLRLRPLCMGHLLLMDRLGLPANAELLIPDSQLLLALIVCGSTYEDGCELLSSPRALRVEIARWKRKVSRRFWFLPRRLDFEEARQIFSKYLEEGSLLPKFRIYEDGPPMKLGAPGLLLLKVRLMEFMSESEALNKHLPLAYLEVFARSEIERGKKLLYDAGDDRLEEMFRNQEAELAELERRFNGQARN